MAEKKTGLVSLLRKAFTGYNPDDKHDPGIALQEGGGSLLSKSMLYGDDGDKSASGAGDQDWLAEKVMPTDRFAKYGILQEMATDPVLSASVDMHLAHALSVDSRTGTILTIEAKTPEHAELAASLQAELGTILNENVASWAKLMAIFGVHYVRPYAEERRGVLDVESSWYTMGQHIREYVRGGLTAGFTSEYLKEPMQGGEIKLVEPWQLVALRVPYWQPNLHIEPLNPSGYRYSLYNDLHRRTPVETQNYGTSFLEFAFPAWCDLNDAIRSLKGSRHNASRIDRFVAVGMDNLDPVRAAQYLNIVGGQMRKDMEAAMRKQRSKGLIPTVWNQLVPNLSGSKGGISIDTQMVSPDIQHIEDIMFHLRRMCSSLGIDVTMLGWGDLMSGGLGDGGFFRTSVQSAIRANWLRVAVAQAANRLIDIHMSYKYGKVFPAGQLRPIEIKFHSLNTAIETEQADAMETRTNYSLALATLLDTIENGRLAGSETFKNMVLTDLIRLDKDKSELIIKELAGAAAKAGDDEYMDSVGYSGPASGFESYLETLIHKQLIDLAGE